MSEKKTVRMIDQFDQIRKAKQKAKENRPKGPIDVLSLRREVKGWNEKNRRPS